MADGHSIITAYCGEPPLPSAIWHRWNLDPVLIVALVLLLFFYLAGAARGERAGGTFRSERVFFIFGWTVVTAGLISPLCPLSVSLFSARVGQHMLFVLIGAPLVAAGRPGVAMTMLLRRASALEPRALQPRSRLSHHGMLPATGAFAAVLWFWHAPAPYAATFVGPWIYWLMHISVFGAALFLWTRLLDPAPSRALAAVAGGLLTTMQMGLLGAVITLAPRPLYAPHALTTAAWGLTPLQDQQLGGAIMWVPGCVIFLMVAIITLRRAITAADAGHAAPPLELARR